MKEFLVSYELHGRVYHSNVITATSEAAMYWIMNAFPEAKEIKVIREVALVYHY